MEQLMEILNTIKPGVDFKNTSNLIDNKILDSFDLITLVMEINTRFGIDIDSTDMLPNNFNSIQDMLNLIEKYMSL